MRRIWHHWEQWECVPAGMYNTTLPPHIRPDEALGLYAAFLSDLPRFETALGRVLDEWPISCEQFLSNSSLNRIAWLGQGSMCIDTGVPACFRAGFKVLTEPAQLAANAMAAKWLRIWEGAYASTNQPIHRHLETTGLPGGYPRRGADRVDAPQPGALIQGDLFGDLEE